MRKIVYSVAMSLDGYLAGPNGEADWIVMDPEIDFMGMMARFDTVLMGRRTFEAVQAQGGGGSMPGVASVVVSRTLRHTDHPGLTIIAARTADIVNIRAERCLSKPPRSHRAFTRSIIAVVSRSPRRSSR